MNPNYEYNWDKFGREHWNWSKRLRWMTLAFNLPANVVYTLALSEASLKQIQRDIYDELQKNGWEEKGLFFQNGESLFQKNYDQIILWGIRWSTDIQEVTMEAKRFIPPFTHQTVTYCLNGEEIYRQKHPGRDNPKEALSLASWCELIVREIKS